MEHEPRQIRIGAIDTAPGENTGSADEILVEVVRSAGRQEASAAYGILVTRYEPFIRALLFRLSRNASVAEELTQIAFVNAWQKLQDLRDPRRFAGWLKQLAYREFLHAYRRQGMEQRHAETVFEPATSEHSQVEDLEAILFVCSPIERELMILCYAFEFTHAEISQARDLSVGTIKSHVHRAKKKLAAAYATAEHQVEKTG